MSKSLSSRRTKAREATQRRRIEAREQDRKLLELVASGRAYDEIADVAGVSRATIKRRVQRAINRRPPEPAATFVALQRERLNKALLHTDLALEEGDLRAVAALVSLLPHLERYWGLQNALHAGQAGAQTAQVLPPKLMTSLPAETVFPPLSAEPARVDGG